MSSYSWPIVSPPAAASTPDPGDIGGDLYGKDVLFKDNGFWLSAGGDYLTVSGEENLRRAIYRRLLVNPGEYPFRPTYGAGIKSFVKKLLTTANKDALRQRCLDQLSQDPRIEEVSEVNLDTVTINGRQAIKIYVKVKAFGKELRFEPLTYSEES